MQILVARKKEISDGYMAYLLTQETCAIEQNSSNRDGKKKDRKEAVTEVSMKLCLQIGFCLPGRYSMVFIDEGHQLELSFWYKCRSDRVKYAQNFNLLLGRLGKPATFHFSE